MTERPKVIRNHKDTLFRMLFKEKKELMELYNALNDTSYDNPDDLEVYTLENAIYMGYKNDVSFLFNSELNLFEQQASYNPNMPLRFLIYITRQYEKYIRNKSIYSSRLIQIPAPKFVVFYNGTANRQERETEKLSDAYEKTVQDPELELKVRMININLGNNKELLDKCETLKQYSMYVERVRIHTENMPVQTAVELAVDDCIREGILADFLLANKTEVISMSIFEYDEEQEMKKIRKDEFDFGWEGGFEQGLKDGHAKGIAEGLEEGLEKGMAEGVAVVVRIYQKLGQSREETVSHIQEDFSLSKDSAADYVNQYWK